jgi:hypothetical protein
MRFTVRRRPDRLRKIIILAVAFALFVAGSFGVLGTRAALILLGISVVVVSLITLELGKFGWYYEIDDSALTVHRTFRAYRISGDSITKVTTDGWSGVRRAVDRVAADGSSGSPGESRQVALGRLVGFSAIPVPVKGPVPPGRDLFVLLERTGGRTYILSPEDPRGFADACRRLMSGR